MTPPLHEDHLAVVGESVDDCCRDRGVVENGRPIFEGTVARQDHGSAFIAAGNDLEEHVRTKTVDREVAELVNDEAIRSGVGAQPFHERAVGLRGL